MDGIALDDAMHSEPARTCNPSGPLAVQCSQDSWTYIQHPLRSARRYLSPMSRLIAKRKKLGKPRSNRRCNRLIDLQLTK